METSFTPDGCSAAVGDVITFGAGQEFEGIYEFAHSHNYRVVGGSSSSVGAAGGWITGGGHSMLSNELGQSFAFCFQNNRSGELTCLLL